MTALYIIAGILLFILVLLLIPVWLKIDYDGDVKAQAGYLFLKFRLYPRPEKPEKKKKTKSEKKPEKEEAEKKKKPNPVISFTKEHGISGLISLIGDILHIVTDILKGASKHLVIKYLVVNAVVVGEDSADTAIKYGYVCSVVYPMISMLDSKARLRSHSEDISAGFLAEKTAVELMTEMRIRPLWIVGVGLSALVRLVVVIIKLAKTKKV